MAIDIDQSFYRTGTATVAANGTAVTGQGTLWTQTCRAGDMFGTHVGDGTRILSVNSNTSLTLAYPWKGDAQTASAYEIQFTPYDVGYQASVRQLLLTLASGNVDALAGLTGAQNTMPYFTGVGTMDRTNLTAFARTLLGRSNGAQVYSDLGIVPDGSIPNRLKERPSVVLDLNAINSNGLYIADDTSVNTPVAGSFYVTHWTNNTGVNAYQVAHMLGSTELTSFSRKKRGNNWEPWNVTTLPVLGNVTMYMGRPAGSIIQRGSNANGEFVRFADGTQQCWGRKLNIPLNATGATEYVLIFPSSFVGEPSVAANPNTPNPSSYHPITINSTSGNSATLGLQRTSGGDGYFFWQAMGRWHNV